MIEPLASLLIGGRFGALFGRFGQCSSGAYTLTANCKQAAIGVGTVTPGGRFSRGVLQRVGTRQKALLTPTRVV